MPERAIIRFDEEEQLQIIEWGKLIHNNKKKTGIHKAPILKRYKPVWIDIFGVAGDVAVHKYIGKKYKFELFLKSDNGDLITRYNNCEIKTNLKKDDNLLKIPKWQINKPFTMYILVKKLFKLECFEIIGFIRTPDLKQKMQLTTFPGHEKDPMYCINRSELEPPEWLKISYFNGYL